MAKRPSISVTPSSGNVFADIGVPDPEEALAKAQLARSDSRDPCCRVLAVACRQLVRGSHSQQAPVQRPKEKKKASQKG